VGLPGGQKKPAPPHAFICSSEHQLPAGHMAQPHGFSHLGRYIPGSHGLMFSQKGWPIFCCILPSSQTRHSNEFDSFENLPTAHAEHWRSLVIVALIMIRSPREHSVNGLQKDMPSSGWNVPPSPV
jgi:hypothetical protein